MSQLVKPYVGGVVLSYINNLEGWDPYAAIIIRVNPDHVGSGNPNRPASWTHRVDLFELWWNDAERTQSPVEYEVQNGDGTVEVPRSGKYLRDIPFMPEDGSFGWRWAEDEKNGDR